MRNEVNFSLRINEDLMIKLKKLALSNNNSVNSEIVSLIIEALRKFNNESESKKL